MKNLSQLSYFRRRLAETQRWSDAPPIVRYHSAASTVDDDTLERSGEPFGSPYGESGFGTSEVFQELLSKDPKYVPISDLAAYQQNLVDVGYLPPTYVPTGNWDQLSSAADRRASRDSFNSSRAGGQFGSASVGTLFRYIGYTIPTSVFEGMYGIAQGIVSDAARAVTNPVEVFEEGGALGGAAVGAGIGASLGLLGGPLAPLTVAAGAVGGGIIGGVAGFFGDLFDDDEEEEGNWEKIVGALSPIDEIRSGDAKNLFAALSTIMSASAVLKAGKVAAQGVQAAGGIPQLATRDAWRMAARDQVTPGILNQVAQAGLRKRVLGGALLGGTGNAGIQFALSGDSSDIISDFFTGAVVGAVGGKLLPKKAADKAIKALDYAPLARLHASPARKVTEALYTGAAAPTLVARGISELGQVQIGTDEEGRPIFEPGTEIGKDIATAPEAPTPVAIVADGIVGMMVFPSRLLPWKAADISQGVKALGSNHVMLPFANFLRTSGTRVKGSVSDAMDAMRTKMSFNPHTGRQDPVLLAGRVHDTHIQHGIELSIAPRVQQRLGELKPPKGAFDRARRAQIEEQITIEERSAVKAQILKEAEEANLSTDIVSTSTGREMAELGASDPVKLQNYMAAQGYDPDFFDAQFLATEHLGRRRTQLQEEGVHYSLGVKGEYLVAQDFETWLTDYKSAASRFKQATDDFNTAAPDVPIEQLDMALHDAGRELERVVLDMRNRNAIDADIFELVRPGARDPGVNNGLASYLEDAAKSRPRMDESLTEELAVLAPGTDRYIAVKTGENMIDYTHFADTAEIQGITEYTRRTAFFDQIASLGARVDRADLGRLRYNSISAHLDDVAGKVLRDETDGRRLANEVYDSLKLRYDESALKRRYGKEATMRVRLGSQVIREIPGEKTTKELFKVMPNDLTAEDLVEGLNLAKRVKRGVDPYEAAERIKKAIHVGAAFGADVAHPFQTARSLGAALRLTGLPAFTDFMRTLNVVPAKFGANAAQTARWKKGSYGFVPQHLRRFHMALQFSLSPTFDASRFIEAWSFGKIRGGDIPIKAAGLNPKRWVKEFEDGWISPNTGEAVSGQAAMEEMVAFGDQVLYGRAVNQNYDELQLRLLHRGVLGFKPRETEYAQAWWLAQKKARKGPLSQGDLEEIRETVMQIGQYGTKQTAFGNSMHFVFFPFLFSRKQLSAIVDFSIGAPTRNLLIHEGVRRWYQVTGDDGTSMSDDFARFMEKHIPLAAELGRINNLSYGVSPGRFFLDGIIDKETEGKVAQGLGSVLLPGGVHQPIANTLGDAVELRHLFAPVVVNDPSQADNVLELMEGLMPAYRDVERWFFDTERHGAPYGIAGAQLTGLTGGTPRAQMSEYLDEKRVLSQTLDAASEAAGFSSWSSLRSSRPDIAGAIDEIENDLNARFPRGFALSQEFTNTAALKEQALYDLAKKEERSKAEEAINLIGELETQAKLVAAQTGKTQEEMLRAIASVIRQYALNYTDDRQFTLIWDALFRSYYGPLRRIEVA